MIQPPWIEITTTLPCPVGCYYCPQAVLQRAYQGERVLTLDRFEAVLRNVPTTVIVDFAGLSEPFGNPQCVDMVLLAHRLGYRLAMNMTLTDHWDELNRDGDFDLCCYCEYWEPRTT